MGFGKFSLYMVRLFMKKVETKSQAESVCVCYWRHYVTVIQTENYVLERNKEINVYERSFKATEPWGKKWKLSMWQWHLNKGHSPDGERWSEATVSQQGSPAACSSWGPFHLREGWGHPYGQGGHIKASALLESGTEGCESSSDSVSKISR